MAILNGHHLLCPKKCLSYLLFVIPTINRKSLLPRRVLFSKENTCSAHTYFTQKCNN